MIDVKKLQRDFDAVHQQAPLVHNITNFVVMNNTANALLAIGASPVMAHAIEEVEDMVQIASSLVINIGTLNADWVKSMVVAGKAALKKGIPVVLDPVGAGATAYRTQECKQLIETVKPTIIRGNASEIMALVNSSVATKGVDSSDSSDSALNSAKQLSRETKAIVVISGPTDYITNGEDTEMVINGSPLMTRVTGMGCTATAITAAFAAINNNYLEAATHAMAVMSIAGERAASKAQGNGTMQLYFLDELCNLTDSILSTDLKQ